LIIACTVLLVYLFETATATHQAYLENTANIIGISSGRPVAVACADFS